MTPGTLYVVATPIGNLEDITLRALRILRDVAVIAAEDTRRTGNLLRHYKIATPLVSLHEHNEHRRSPQVLARLEQGDDVAFVTDAGTPGIADPGALLVAAARTAGLRVEPVPGPSAITAALSASGLLFDRFLFAGFAPSRSNDRKRWLLWVATHPDIPVVAYEAPHRVEHTLREAGELLVERPVIVARELTKAHEEWTVLRRDQVGVQQGVPARGEFVLIFAPTARVAGHDPPSDDRIVTVFGQKTEFAAFNSKRDAIRAVAEELGIAPKAVYDALERTKPRSA